MGIHNLPIPEEEKKIQSEGLPVSERIKKKEGLGGENVKHTCRSVEVLFNVRDL